MLAADPWHWAVTRKTPARLGAGFKVKPFRSEGRRSPLIMGMA